MKKEIIEINKKSGIYRVTTLDERWYAKTIINEKTGLPEGYEYYPSSTWIAGYYPKGINFYKWLAQKGWDEAEALKNAAGERGSKVHSACQIIDNGQEIKLDEQFLNPVTGKLEEIKPDEIEAILSYIEWLEDIKPTLLTNELTGFNEEYKYAGTIDKIYRIGKQIVIIDLKTSSSIWEEQKLQISSYCHLAIAYQELGITGEEWQNRKMGILQLGYIYNKLKKYKFTEIEDKFDLFLTAKQIWANENPESKPKQKDFPLILKSEFRQKELKIPPSGKLLTDKKIIKKYYEKSIAKRTK